jgi:NAD(P)H dehydrogenase (quinone)
MKVLTVYAHPNPKSFCHAVLEQFTKGLNDAGHTNKVVDFYAIKFNPVLQMKEIQAGGTGLLHGLCFAIKAI